MVSRGGDALRLPQNRETPPQVKRGGWLALRYAYARAADTIAANETGQDYLTVALREASCVFALCDGVSQSFFGNLAARLLGDGLLAFLSDELPAQVDAASFAELLRARLQGLAREGGALVAAYPLPPTLPPMLRDVLAQKRALGSESTFVCGRIDRPSATVPRGRLLLAWMGDSRLRFWGARGERTAELGATFRTEERWSTLSGLVGEGPHVFVGGLLEGQAPLVTRLALYSDGLSALDRVDGTLSSFAVADLIERAGLSAKSDDISLLELWSGDPPSVVDVKPLPPPTGVAAQPSGAGRALVWRPVAGATGYEVEARVDRGAQIWPLSAATPSWQPPADLTPAAALRVRARAGNEPGRWSERIPAARIVPPSPPAPSRAPVAAAAAGMSVPPAPSLQRRAASAPALREPQQSPSPYSPNTSATRRVPILGKDGLPRTDSDTTRPLLIVAAVMLVLGVLLGGVSGYLLRGPGKNIPPAATATASFSTDAPTVAVVAPPADAAGVAAAAALVATAAQAPTPSPAPTATPSPAPTPPTSGGTGAAAAATKPTTAAKTLQPATVKVNDVPVCTAVIVTLSAEAPPTNGVSLVTVSASAVGCSDPSYKFSINSLDTKANKFSDSSDYTSGSTKTWSLPASVYLVTVSARNGTASSSINVQNSLIISVGE